MIHYRIGDYSSFRKTMLENIDSFPNLKEWKGRSDEDPGIQLINLWAYLADILTFYQERIINETFLRTATFRESIEKLAKLLDYRPNPGKASEGYVTFTLDKEKSLTIPAGFRVKSKPVDPGSNEKPQVFEVLEPRSLDHTFNQLNVIPVPVSQTTMNIIDTLTICSSVQNKSCPIFSIGDTVVVYDRSESWNGTIEREVCDVREELGRTILSWKPETRITVSSSTRICKVYRKLRLCGYNAPTSVMVPDNPNGTISAWKIDQVDFSHSMKTASNSDRDDRLLERVLFYLEGEGIETSYDFIELLQNRKIFDIINKMKTSGIEEKMNLLMALHDFMKETFKEELFLEDIVDDLKDGTDVLLVIKGESPEIYPCRIREVTEANYTLHTGTGCDVPGFSRTVTRIKLMDARKNIPFFINIEDIRDVVLYELKGNICAPDLDEIDPRISPNTQHLSLIHGVRNNVQTRDMILTDNTGTAEKTTIINVSDTIELSAPTKKTYETTSASLLGNVVKVGHGEYCSEIAGSGDSSRKYQTLMIRKKPVTFVPSANASSGVRNSLEIFVNDILWKEVDTFFDSGPEDRVYITYLDEDDHMHVQFGDGINGARLPTGKDNVIAHYRCGKGESGNVPALSVSSLVDSITGLKSVSNPTKIEGGVEPESEDEMKKNAPSGVMTFGRAVSLKDHESLTLAYTGVTKSRAILDTTPEQAIIRIIVAGSEGEEGRILTDDEKTNLMNYLNARRDTNHQISIRDFIPSPVIVKATIHIKDDHIATAVKNEVEKLIIDFFSFRNQDFGNHQHKSDLYGMIQGIKGVHHLDISEFRAERDPTAWELGATFREPNPFISLEDRVDWDHIRILECQIPFLDILEINTQGGLPG